MNRIRSSFFACAVLLGIVSCFVWLTPQIFQVEANQKPTDPPVETTKSVFVTYQAERHSVIESVKEAIASSGGWILDFKLFSDLSTFISFEMPQENLVTFHGALSKIDLQLNEASSQAIYDLTDQQTCPSGNFRHIADHFYPRRT